MQEGPSGGQDQPRSPEPDVPGVGGGERAPDPLAAEAAELRRLVEAGAGSPEELRALAARLREHRQREEARWRAEVKPQLVKQGKGRLRRQPPAMPPPPLLPAPGLAGSAAAPAPPPAGTTGVPPAEPVSEVPAASAPWSPPATGLPPLPITADPAPGSRALWLGLGLLAMVGLAVLAASTTVWVLLLPVIALLVWAWSQGRDAQP